MIFQILHISVVSMATVAILKIPDPDAQQGIGILLHANPI